MRAWSTETNENIYRNAGFVLFDVVQCNNRAMQAERKVDFVVLIVVYDCSVSM